MTPMKFQKQKEIKIVALYARKKIRPNSSTLVCTSDHKDTLRHILAYMWGRLHNDTCVAGEENIN